MSIKTFTHKNILVLFLLCVFQFFSCTTADRPPKVDHIEVSLDSRRLDKDLYQVDTNNLAASMILLREKYPDFLDFYLDTLLGFGVHGQYDDNHKAISEGVRSFVTEGDYRDLLDTIFSHYPDVKKQDKELTKSFQYLKHYFPEVEIPKVIYFSSGLNNWGAITVGNIQGIGLDMFLGTQYKYYGSVGLAPYLYLKFIPEFIPVAVMSTQYELLQPFQYEGKPLLDLMIQKGKLQYFLAQTVPFVPEHVRLGYSKEQLQFCEDSEKEIYAFFIQQKLLYQSNLQSIMRYVLDGPNTTGMPAEAPGNIGTWLGYRMVKQYMDKHPEVTLKELIKPVPAEQFLRESRYKP